MLYHNKNGEPVGRITNIQKYTIHDGPGIRTEIFFKGCPMRCLWCSNPETQMLHVEPGLYPHKCISEEKCSWCKNACPHPELLIFGEDGKIEKINSNHQCLECTKCAEACPAGAIKKWGEEYTVAELLKIILEDRSYYLKTHGGVTLNGGEVLLQHEFATMLLKACKEAGIHTCVESALNIPRENLDSVLPYTDMLYTDIKHMDPEKHTIISGDTNEQILDNIKYAASTGIPMVIRTPVTIGYNGDEECIRAIGKFIRDELNGRIVQYQLLPYRKMGTEKYASLQREYPLGDDYVPADRSEWEQNLLKLRDILVNEYKLPAVAGSGKKVEA